jgi:hypothetical protein
MSPANDQRNAIGGGTKLLIAITKGGPMAHILIVDANRGGRGARNLALYRLIEDRGR